MDRSDSVRVRGIRRNELHLYQWSRAALRSWPQPGGFLQPTAQVQVLPCTVSRIEYLDPDSGWTTSPSTSFVHKGTQVSLRTIRGEAATFPSRQPTWGGTSGLSGSGASKTVTLNSTGDKRVTASCDNTITANLKVYDLEGMLTPADNFQGRSIMKFGIMEEINLSFATNPSGLTAGEVGDPQWTQVAGGGSLTTEAADGLGTYIAPDRADGDVNFKLEISAGPSKGRGPTFDRTVVIPSGAYLEQTQDTGIRHTQGVAGVGFAGTPFLEPRDVSFGRIQVREGKTTADATGLLSADDGKEHPASSAKMVGSCTSQNECQIATTDFVDSGDWRPNLPPSPPWAAGTFTWEIPLEYRNANGSWVEFVTWKSFFAAGCLDGSRWARAGTEFSWAGPFSFWAQTRSRTGKGVGI